ncbi:MAG: hypothetical protein EAS52_24285 [Parapedobacter sp.]|nr:MAG: hypothetical protein EAS52_24285 [Parapedobacter sp.]
MKDWLILISEYLGVDVKTLVTVFTTIFVFVAGILINSTVIQIRNFYGRRSHRILSRLNHKDLLCDIYRQGTNYNFFIKQLDINFTSAYNFQYRIMPSLGVFREIGYKSLYNAYFTGPENFLVINKKKRLRAFNALWRAIEYVEHTSATSLIRGKEVIEKQGELNELHNRSNGKAQQLIEQFRLKFTGQLGSNEPLGIFFNEREKIIENWINQKDRISPPNTNSYLVKILELNRKNVELTRRYDIDIKSVELNGHILESCLRYENMSNHIASANGHFNYLFKEYRSTFEKLKVSYRILNNSNFKIR